MSKPQLNWPTATAAMVLGSLGIIVWFILVYTGKIPAQVPAWYVPAIGGPSFIAGAFFDIVRWVRKTIDDNTNGEGELPSRRPDPKNRLSDSDNEVK